MSRPALLLLAALCVAGASFADEEAAAYFAGRGAKAEGTGKWDDARAHYRKSLAEMDGYVPALLGLARVAHAEGDSRAALELLEECLAQPGTRALGRDERTALAEARRLLEEIDRPRGELRAIKEDYITALMSLARRSAGKKPLVARECVERVLKLDPRHAAARKLLAELSKRPRTESDDGERLWNGKDLKGWTGRPPIWTAKDGVLLGAAGDASYWMRALREVKGDFTLECELRVVKDSGTDPLFEICFGAEGAYTNHGLWIVDDEWRLVLRKAEQDRADLRTRKFNLVDKKFSLWRWHTYRIEVKGRRVTCLLGDKKIFEHKSPADEIAGFVGFNLQHRSVEIRRLVLRR